jgi:hypothetical protein
VAIKKKNLPRENIFIQNLRHLPKNKMSAKKYFTINFILLIHKSCIQQEEESFYPEIGLKFEEETSKMLLLEHGFVWC